MRGSELLPTRVIPHDTNLDKSICQQPPQPEPQNRWNLRVILPTKLLPILRIISSKSRLEQAVHDEPALEEHAQDLVQWAVEVVLLSGKKIKKETLYIIAFYGRRGGLLEFLVGQEGLRLLWVGWIGTCSRLCCRESRYVRWWGPRLRRCAYRCRRS